MSEWNISANASALHRKALVIDMLLPWLDYGSKDLRFGVLPRMVASGYTFISLTLALDGESVQDTIFSIARERSFFLANTEKYIIAETADDIVRAKKEGKLAVGFSFQGTEPVGRDLNMVDAYYKLGVRLMLMAYNQKNAVGDGCHELTNSGLSRFGVQLIERMNRVGMLVDVSHTGYRTSMDVIEASKDPVIFSHSNPYDLFEHGRNIRDDQIKSCAESGGVIGINGCGMFMKDNDVSPEALLRLIDYHAEIAGPGHVGIGLDYLYDLPAWLEFVQSPINASRYPDDGDYRRMDVRFAEPEEVPHLTEGLLKRGYSEPDIRGILGENWLRVIRQVWR